MGSGGLYPQVEPQLLSIRNTYQGHATAASAEGTACSCAAAARVLQPTSGAQQTAGRVDECGPKPVIRGRWQENPISSRF